MIGMRQIKNLIKEALKSTVYEMNCILETSADSNVTDILTYIRAQPGITIVTLREASQELSQLKGKAYLTVKFLPIGPSTAKYLKELVSRVRAIEGVYSFQINERSIMDTERKRKIKASYKKKHQI
jgi:hypothetical protein